MHPHAFVCIHLYRSCIRKHPYVSISLTPPKINVQDMFSRRNQNSKDYRNPKFQLRWATTYQSESNSIAHKLLEKHKHTQILSFPTFHLQAGSPGALGICTPGVMTDSPCQTPCVQEQPNPEVIYRDGGRETK